MTDEIYHFTMPHLEGTLLFKVQTQFAAAVNAIAAATLRDNVSVLAYVLMSNHLHLLLKGPLESCCSFYSYLMRRIRMITGITGIIKNTSHMVEITDERMLKHELAYILRNPYKARIASPFSYRWSSADSYFSHLTPHGIPIRDIEERRKRELFGTRIRIPDTWEHQDGVILNHSFVDYKYVENLFNSSVWFFDYVRRYDIESAVAIARGEHQDLTFSDEIIIQKATVICQEEYHASSIPLLDNKTLLLLARTLSKRYYCTQGQISRVLAIPHDILDKIL